MEKGVFQKLIFDNTKTPLQELHSNSFYLVKKFPPWGILILADIRPMHTGLNLDIGVHGDF